MSTADEQAIEAARSMLMEAEQESFEEVIVAADRMTPDDFRSFVAEASGSKSSKPSGGIQALPRVDMTSERTVHSRWLE